MNHHYGPISLTCVHKIVVHVHISGNQAPDSFQSSMIAQIDMFLHLK